MTRYKATLLLDDTEDRWGPQVIEEWVSNATHDEEKRWEQSGVHSLSLDVKAVPEPVEGLTAPPRWIARAAACALLDSALRDAGYDVPPRLIASLGTEMTDLFMGKEVKVDD